MPNNQNSPSDSGKSPQQMTANNICIRNDATSAAELYSQLLTCYGIDGAETLRNRRDFTMESQLALIGGWWCLIMCWRSHFCCQMLFCLVENHDKAASWQGDRLSVLTPSARCLIDSVCVYERLCVHPSVRVHVCVYCHGTVCVCVCVARWREAHAALIRPLIPGCCNAVGVKSDTLSRGWDEMLTLLSCARVIKSYVYPYRSELQFEMHRFFCLFVFSCLPSMTVMIVAIQSLSLK